MATTLRTDPSASPTRFHRLGMSDNAELKAQMELLARELDAVARLIGPELSKVVADSYEVVAAQATSATPDKRRIRDALRRIVETAGNVGQVAAPIIELAHAIGTLLGLP